VLSVKLDGQRRIVEESLDDEASAALIADACARLEGVGSTEQAMSAESQAAVAYWSAWESEPLRFARSDLAFIPVHWPSRGHAARRSRLLRRGSPPQPVRPSPTTSMGWRSSRARWG
jgi:hypothetical protein